MSNTVKKSSKRSKRVAREVAVRKASNSFVESLSDKDDNILNLLVQSFEFAEGNVDFQTLLASGEAFINVKKLMFDAVIKVYANKPSQRDEYVIFVNNLFGDSHDIGTIISLLMKCVDEVSKFTDMSGPQKKQIVNTVFEKILYFSPLEDGERKLARLAFSGIVEAIIWAKHGGLQDAKKKCSKLCWCK